jgi:hypothetical protein
VGHLASGDFAREVSRSFPVKKIKQRVLKRFLRSSYY